MTTHERIAHSFFLAMQTGAMAEHEMMTLFADDAVYVEPFSGTPTSHAGKDAILAVMRQSWVHPLPDVRINVDRLQVDGETVTADWTCHSPALPGGRGCGTNIFTLRAGRISRLVTMLRDDSR